MKSQTKKKRNKNKKIINGMMRCSCGCGKYFPATPEYFIPKADCICGFSGVSRECRNLKNRREAAEKRQKSPLNEMRGELCQYYPDYVYC